MTTTSVPAPEILAIVLGKPQELARLAAFALSDAAPNMTGSALVLDAGRLVG